MIKIWPCFSNLQIGIFLSPVSVYQFPLHRTKPRECLYAGLFSSHFLSGDRGTMTIVHLIISCFTLGESILRAVEYLLIVFLCSREVHWRMIEIISWMVVQDTYGNQIMQLIPQKISFIKISFNYLISFKFVKKYSIHFRFNYLVIIV